MHKTLIGRFTLIIEDIYSSSVIIRNTISIPTGLLIRETVVLHQE